MLVSLEKMKALPTSEMEEKLEGLEGEVNRLLDELGTDPAHLAQIVLMDSATGGIAFQGFIAAAFLRKELASRRKPVEVTKLGVVNDQEEN